MLKVRVLKIRALVSSLLLVSDEMLLMMNDLFQVLESIPKF